MLKFAIRNLMSRPVRSLLSLLGLTVAIVGMVGLFSVARGIDRTLSTTFGRFSGLVAMQTGAPIPLFSRIPASWANEIEQTEGVAVVNREVWQRANLINGKMILAPPRFLFGTDIASRLQLTADPYQTDLLPGRGRFLTTDDVGTTNAVISLRIADEFQVDVDDTMNVNGYDLTVVGIYHCNSLLLDVAIILDIDQVRTMSRFDAESLSSLYIEQTGTVDDETLIASIEQLFHNRPVDRWRSQSTEPGNSVGNSVVDGLLRAFTPKNNSSAAPSDGTPDATAAPPETAAKTSSPIEIRSAVEWADRFESLSEDLNLFLGVMTSIGVTIAVLSIVNTMLMSVSERFIEFGILKANGWSRRDVLRLITCESATLGLSGGLLGSLFGWVAVEVINAQWPERVQLYASPGLLIFSVIFATALGMLGGLYPAVWAMRMSPMEAIRRG